MGRNRRTTRTVDSRLSTSDATDDVDTPPATGSATGTLIRDNDDGLPHSDQQTFDVDAAHDDPWDASDGSDPLEQALAEAIEPPDEYDREYAAMRAEEDAANYEYATPADIAGAVSGDLGAAFGGGQVIEAPVPDSFDGDLMADTDDDDDGPPPEDIRYQLERTIEDETLEPIARMPVTGSAMVRSFGYDPALRRFDIDLGGRVYVYPNIDQGTAEAFYDAARTGASVGRLYNARLRRGASEGIRAPHLDGTPTGVERCPQCGEFTSPGGFHACTATAASTRLTDDPRTYRADDGTALTIQNATSIRRGLAEPGSSVETDITYTDPVVGTIETTATIHRGRARPEITRPDSFTGTDEEWTAAERRAQDAVYAVRSARRIRQAIPNLARIRAAADAAIARSTATAAASTAAAQAAQAARPNTSTSYATNPAAFQQIHRDTTARISRQEPAVQARPDTAGSVGSQRRFGLEIEFVGGNRQAIARDLHAAGLIPRAYQEGYHAGQHATGIGNNSWRFEADCTVDGEIISPPLEDSPESWEQVRQVIEIVERNGGTTMHRSAGMHINIEAHDGDHDAGNYDRLVRNFHAHADTIMRLSSDPRTVTADGRRGGGSHRGTTWCNPNSVPTSVPDMNEPGYGGRRYRSSAFLNDHHRGINMAHATGNNRSSDRVEFRTANGAMDIGTIQARVMVARALIERSFNPPADAPAPSGRQTYGENRRRFGSRRLTGEEWHSSTAPGRQLVDQLFDRDVDKQQVLQLFSATRWQQGR